MKGYVNGDALATGLRCAAWLLAATPCAHADTPAASPVLDGLLSSFSFSRDDLVARKYGSEWRNALDGLSLRVGLVHPLKRAAAPSGAGRQGDRSSADSLQVALHYAPVSYWFVGLTSIAYRDRDLQQPWDPDYTYAFGYDDWHPYTLSLVYANYGGNRFRPAAGESSTRFDEGQWTLGWKFNLPEAVERAVLIGNGDSAGCNLSLAVTPRFQDAATLAYERNKWVGGLGCRYALRSGWYANFTLLRYLDAGQQQPWNPDYTYGFGYFDWRPGSFSLQYNNYSGNRYSPSERGPGTGRFENGALTLSWTQAW